MKRSLHYVKSLLARIRTLEAHSHRQAYRQKSEMRVSVFERSTTASNTIESFHTVIDFASIVDALNRHHRDILRRCAKRGTQGWRAYMGCDEFNELSHATDKLDLRFSPITVSGERFPEYRGIVIVVVPWMKGVLIVPWDGVCDA